MLINIYKPYKITIGYQLLGMHIQVVDFSLRQTSKLSSRFPSTAWPAMKMHNVKSK